MFVLRQTLNFRITTKDIQSTTERCDCLAKKRVQTLTCVLRCTNCKQQCCVIVWLGGFFFSSNKITICFIYSAMLYCSLAFPYIQTDHLQHNNCGFIWWNPNDRFYIIRSCSSGTNLHAVYPHVFSGCLGGGRLVITFWDIQSVCVCTADLRSYRQLTVISVFIFVLHLFLIF